MGKRYYCDYCDRTFIDDVESRKKHIKCINHERNRKNHYLKYRDLKTLLEEESAKMECKRYRTTGSCSFGDLCTYTHYSKMELQMFALEVANMKKQKNDQINQFNVKEWLKKRQYEGGKLKYFNLEPHPLQASGMLPPSLLPPTLDQIRNTQFEMWG